MTVPPTSWLVPIFRVEDGRAAAVWYERLGFVVVGEHRFEPQLPLYLFLRRGNVHLHLSEHAGDAPHGSLSYFYVDDLDTIRSAFDVEVTAQPWGREIELTDPFGNRLRIGESSTRHVTTGAPLDGIRWPRRTERLTLRPATIDDVEATWRFRQLDEVSRWLTRAVSSLDEHRALFEDPEWLAKTLVIELEGEVIGDLMVAVQGAWAQAEVADNAKCVQGELGWVLHPDHGGRGYATEAVRELIRICFEELGLRRVVADCFTRNESSWRLMERVGMRREGHTVRDSLHRSGEWLDGLSYALLTEEWEG